MVLALIAAAAQSTLTDVGSIAAIVAGAISLLVLLWGIARWLRQRRLVRSPAEVVFLIPQAEYPAATFVGAPAQEQQETDIALGIGEYEVPIRLLPRLAINVQSMRVQFVSSGSAEPPLDLGARSPFFVEELTPVAGQRQVRDWWGVVHTEPFGLPRDLPKGQYFMTGRRIKTQGQWSGKVVVSLEFGTRNGPDSREFRKPLGFNVVENPAGDRLPFLRR